MYVIERDKCQFWRGRGGVVVNYYTWKRERQRERRRKRTYRSHFCQAERKRWRTWQVGVWHGVAIIVVTSCLDVSCCVAAGNNIRWLSPLKTLESWPTVWIGIAVSLAGRASIGGCTSTCPLIHNCISYVCSETEWLVLNIASRPRQVIVRGREY